MAGPRELRQAVEAMVVLLPDESAVRLAWPAPDAEGVMTAHYIDLPVEEGDGSDLLAVARSFAFAMALMGYAAGCDHGEETLPDDPDLLPTPGFGQVPRGES